MCCSFGLRSARLGKDRTRTGKVTRDGHVSEVLENTPTEIGCFHEHRLPIGDEPLGGVMELHSYACVWYSKSRAA